MDEIANTLVAQRFSKIPSSFGQHHVQVLRLSLLTMSVMTMCPPLLQYVLWGGLACLLAGCRVTRAVINDIWSNKIIFFQAVVNERLQAKLGLWIEHPGIITGSGTEWPLSQLMLDLSI